MRRAGDLGLDLLPRLAAEPQAHGATADFCMAAAERGQAEGSVLPRVLVVADTDERLLHELHNRGHHLFVAQAGPAHVARYTPAYAGQHAAEADQPRILVGVA